MLSYEQIRAALADRPLPAAFVDLDALEHNLDVVRDTAAGLPVRVASKSLRSTDIVRRLLADGRGALRGVMCFAAAEALHLARAGIGDLVLAYPIFRRADVELAADAVAHGARLRLVADHAGGVQRLAEVARARRITFEVLACVDMSLRLPAGIHIGVRRSPLHDPADVVALARAIADAPGLRFSGLLGYEAQVAGLGDALPGRPALSAALRLVKRTSMRELSERRRAMVAALGDAGLAPELVNGGGSGSLDATTTGTGVTEGTAGSAFFKPHLFDAYAAPHMRRLEPAAFFALEITRLPAPGFVTCSGGGYVASGAAGRDKVPLPHLPAGLRLVDAEMCGEVQTPLVLPTGLGLGLGDPVVFRHAKAGELCERFTRLLLVRGGRVDGDVATYRGEGLCFL